MARIKGSIPAKSAEIRGAPTKKRATPTLRNKTTLESGSGLTLAIIGAAAGLLCPVSFPTPVRPLTVRQHFRRSSLALCLISALLLTQHNHGCLPDVVVAPQPQCRGCLSPRCLPASRLVPPPARTTSLAPTMGGTPTSTTPSGPATRPSTSATSSVRPYTHPN